AQEHHHQARQGRARGPRVRGQGRDVRQRDPQDAARDAHVSPARPRGRQEDDADDRRFQVDGGADQDGDAQGRRDRGGGPLVRTTRYLVQELGREPIPEEISERMELPLDKVRKVLKIAKEPISLETPIGEEEDSHLGDFIEDKSIVSPSESVISVNLADQTRKVLATLTPREEKVLRMRFGIGEKSDHTLEEVGQDFEVTRERIRQIEAKALRKLRHPSRSKRLKAFVEN